MNMSSSLIALSNRSVVSLKGADVLPLLQGLVTNDVEKLNDHPILFAAWLSPQGRFWHDFFIIKAGNDSYFITPETSHQPDLLKKLSLYKLRKDVTIKEEADSLKLVASLKNLPETEGLWFEDPRIAAMGYLGIVPKTLDAKGSLEAYDAHRILLGVPDGGRDLVVDKAIILENNYNELNGISWDKGCYMGQELMARTHHRGEVRKKLVPVKVDGGSTAFGSILLQGTQKVGTIKSSAGPFALALIHMGRLDQSEKALPIMTEAGQKVSLI
jgi:folate-binding protein YgfZ